MLSRATRRRQIKCRQNAEQLAVELVSARGQDSNHPMSRTPTKDRLRNKQPPAVNVKAEAVSFGAASSSRTWVAPAILVFAILVTFGSVCAHEFTNWDDKLNVTYNPHLNPPTLGGLVYFWEHPYAHEYIPLSYTVWWLLAQVARVETPDAAGIWLNPYIFHTANLLLHLGVSLLVYRLLLLLTRRPWAACAGALLFALHPIQAEAVAWVTGLKDLLCALFTMLALWQYVLFAKTEARERLRGWHYAAATAALVAAMLAKPSAVTVPIIAAAIDWLLLGRSLRRVAMAIAPWAVVSAVMVAIGILSHPTGPDVGGPILMRPLIAADSIAFYLGKVIWPVGFSAVYHHSTNDVLASRSLYLAWVFPTAVGILIWMLRKRFPWLVAAAIIFVAALLPVLGLVAFEFEMISTVADRYAYVAMLGPSIAVAFAFCSIESHIPRDSHIPSRSWAWMAGGATAVGMLLAVLSFRQARYWHDSRTLFTRVLAVDPKSDVAYSNLAADALDYGRPAEAAQYASQAEKLDPDRPNNGITLGVAFQRLGRHDEARKEFFRVAQAHPDNTVALTNLAIELQRSGHVDQAIAICRGLVQIEPQAADAHHFLAALLLQEHRTGDALPEAAEAVRLDPKDAENHWLYGKLLALSGHQPEADQQFAAARAIAPAGSDPGNLPAPVNSIPR